jgi:hypothetical protein
MTEDADQSTPAKDGETEDGIRRVRQAVEMAIGHPLPSTGSVGEQCDAVADAVYELADRQRSPARKWIAWSVVAVLLLGAYSAWPLLGLYRLASAVEARNAALLTELVDFPSTRRSVARQVSETYLKLTGRNYNVSPLVQSVAIGTLANLVDPIVARAFNPETIGDLLGSGTSVDGIALPPNTAPFTVASLDSAWKVWLDSEHSPRTFYVRLPPDIHPAERFRLMLELKAWKWRLARIDLPEVLRVRLAQEVIKAEAIR